MCGAAEQDGGNTLDVGRETRCVQRADVLRNRHQHLAAEMAALLFAGELVFEMDAGGARFDHGAHQFERVQRAAEAGLGVGDDRRHPIFAAVTLELADLVGAAKRVVDAADDHRHRVDGIERLVGIHLAREVRVGRDLPAGKIDRLEAGLDLLHGLVAGERAERVHIGFGLEQVPKALRAHLGQRVADAERARQALDFGWRVIAADAGEALGIVARGAAHAVGRICRGGIAHHRSSSIFTDARSCRLDSIGWLISSFASAEDSGLMPIVGIFLSVDAQGTL